MLYHIAVCGKKLGRLCGGGNLSGNNDPTVQSAFSLYGEGNEGDPFHSADHGGFQPVPHAGRAACILLAVYDHRGRSENGGDDGGAPVLSDRRIVCYDAHHDAEQSDRRTGKADEAAQDLQGAGA